MKKRYKNGSLCVKISAIFVTIIFMVMGSFAFILYGYFQNIIQEHITKAVNTTAEVNAKMMENLLRRIEISCDLVHDNSIIYTDNNVDAPIITAMIVEYTNKKNAQEQNQFRDEYDANLNMFNDYFTTCFGEDTGYTNILFTNSSWNVHKVMPMRSLSAGGNGFSSDMKVKEEKWYQKTRELGGETYWFVEESGKLCMTKTIIYRHMENNLVVQEEDLGVLAVKLDVSAISGVLDLSSLTEDSAVLLYDSDSAIVYANKNEFDSKDVEAISEYLGTVSSTNVQYKGEQYIINQKTLPLGLNMFTLVPVRDISEIAAQTIRIILVLGAVMIGIAVFITIYLSRTIFRPLREFANYMEGGSTEPFTFEQDRKDELGTLYRAYNHLMKQLADTMEKELTISEEKRKIELKALQLQINPHFTYNTLHSIACLALMGGQDEVADLIGNLTKILRYNIGNTDKRVQIQEEIYIIHQYENIQKSCYRDSVTIEYDVAEETKEFLIPKLIIQPLVENAFHYGTDSQDNQVYVKLTVRVQEEQLVISVWDSGIEADINSINAYINGKIEYETGSLGVRNVYERILLAYGKGVQLYYMQDEEKHTIAVICIPVDKL